MEIHTREVHVSNVVLALLFLLAGGVLLFWPLKAMTICCQFIGSIIVFYGLTRFYMYYKQYHEGSYAVSLNLVVGLLTTAGGLFVFFRPNEVIRLFPYLAGLTLLLQAVIKVQQGLEIRHVGFTTWKGVMIMALINVIAGIVLLFNPFEAVEVTLRVIALFLLYEGISECWSLYQLSKAGRFQEPSRDRIENASYDLIDVDE